MSLEYSYWEAYSAYGKRRRETPRVDRGPAGMRAASAAFATLGGLTAIGAAAQLCSVASLPGSGLMVEVMGLLVALGIATALMFVVLVLAMIMGRMACSLVFVPLATVAVAAARLVRRGRRLGRARRRLLGRILTR